MGVHHSTFSTRIDVISAVLGFDPLDGLWGARLAWPTLGTGLRRSTVLDLPVPAPAPNAVGPGGR